jgi:DNA-binding transcriptional MerR regulator
MQHGGTKLKEEYYQIGEVSKITGISKDTLHFYTKAGLVTPDYINPDNHYHYYSRWNMYQLDIITTCRNLGIPLDKVRQIISSKDNDKVVHLLMEYRKEALRLSEYYAQVADDILWYDSENEHIKAQTPSHKIQVRYLEQETVIAGSLTREDSSYHANLQEVLKQEFQQTHFVRRKYGYFLDPDHLLQNDLLKCREYMKLPNGDYSSINPEHLYTLPAGDYAVFTVQIQDETADFSPLLDFLSSEGFTTDIVFAEEIGFQLFKYIHNYYCEIKAHLIKK